VDAEVLGVPVTVRVIDKPGAADDEVETNGLGVAADAAEGLGMDEDALYGIPNDDIIGVYAVDVTIGVADAYIRRIDDDDDGV
jgi:hypothetical protein